MTHVLLFLLFLVLYSAETLNLNLSFAPGLSVKNALLYLAFLALAIETAVTRRRSLELVPVFAPFVLYVCYAVFTWLVALLVIDYAGYSLRGSLFTLKSGPVENLMVLLIFFYGANDARRALWLLRGMIWLVIVGNVITVIDGLNMPDLGIIHEREDGRVGGPIGSANQFAYFLALCLPLIVALYWTESGFKKVLAGAGLMFSTLAFLMAVSRGGIVGLAGGAIIGGILLRRVVPFVLLIRVAMVAILLSAVVMVVLFATDYGELLMNRFAQFGGGTREATSGRDIIWARLLNKMLETPVSFVTGFGWYAYKTFQGQYEFGFATHSTYLEILFDLGIVGLVLFMAVAFGILRATLKAVSLAEPESRPFLLGFIVGFLSLLVALSFGNLFSPWLYIWALTGISLRLAVAQEQSPLEMTQLRAGRLDGTMRTKGLRQPGPALKQEPWK